MKTNPGTTLHLFQIGPAEGGGGLVSQSTPNPFFNKDSTLTPIRNKPLDLEPGAAGDESTRTGYYQVTSFFVGAFRLER